jgi:hypothetical protein
MPAGFPCRLRWLVPLIAGLLAMPAVAAEGPDGTYEVKRISGVTYVEGDRFDFPPQAILAAAVGRGIVVENDRIQKNEHARADISRAMVKDPRLLGKVVTFRIGQLPRFGRFKESADGVLRAETIEPFVIGLTVENHNLRSDVTAWAYYRAEIRGNELTLRVRFYGDGGNFYGDYDDYEIQGRSKIVARRK